MTGFLHGSSRLVLGTRASPLALAQTSCVGAAFRERCGVETEVHAMKTTGDVRLDVELGRGLSGLLEKGLFTRELEEALATGTIDVAVHSLKDLPTELPEGLVLAGVLEREDPADVLISKTPGGLEGLDADACVATGSERRKSQLTAARADLRVAPIRGNIATRLRKLGENDQMGGLVLARAGLVRLGYDLSGPTLSEESPYYVTDLSGVLLPAPGQGAIGLEVAAAGGRVRALVDAVNDEVTWVCVAAERLLLRRLGGGCHCPLGVLAKCAGGSLSIEACYFPEEGSARRGSVEGPVEEVEDLVQHIAFLLAR